MALQFKYTYGDTPATYTFNASTTLIPLVRSFEFDARGRRNREHQTWKISTVLQGASQAALTTLIQALETAMDVDEGTMAILNGAGGATPHTVSDVRILTVAYPKATGSEYANQRTVEVSMDGYKEISGKDDDLISFTESVFYRGGGARSIWQETITGKPQKTQVAEHTLYEAAQRGSAVSKGDTYPDPPGPLFPGSEIEQEPELTRTPERTPDGLDRYRLDWIYRFASGEELVAEPNTWQ